MHEPRRHDQSCGVRVVVRTKRIPNLLGQKADPLYIFIGAEDFEPRRVEVSTSDHAELTSESTLSMSQHRPRWPSQVPDWVFCGRKEVALRVAINSFYHASVMI